MTASDHPGLLWLAVTILVFDLADWLSRHSGRHPLLHPVLLASATLIALLVATGASYSVYAAETWPLTFLLGPATVSLAVPLWRYRHMALRHWRPVACALMAGATLSVTSAVAISAWLGAPPEVVASLAPRAATTPVAMTLAQNSGGLPSLAALVVLTTGLLGAIAAEPIARRLRFGDDRALGLALGVAAHGIGTARAFVISQTAGAFSTLGLTLNVILTTSLVFALL